MCICGGGGGEIIIKIIIKKIDRKKYKTALCANFMDGTCPYAEKCNFAHGDHELRGRGKLMTSEKKWRTELCADWERGKCKYGDKCRLAHGGTKLRQEVDKGKNNPSPPTDSNTNRLDLSPLSHSNKTFGFSSFK